MFGREVVEGEQDVSVLLQALDRFGELGSVPFAELLERLQRLALGRGHVHLVEQPLGAGLNLLGHLVQHVGGLVNPAALLARLGEHLGQRRPEAQRAVAHGQPGRFLESATLQVAQRLHPRQLAFALAVVHGHQLFLAVFQRSHDHQHAGPLLGEPHVEVDAVGPEVDVAPLAQVAAVPLLELVLPRRLEPADRGRREPGRALAEDRLQGVGEVVGRDALEVEPGDQRLHAGRTAQIRRKDLAGEPLALAAVAHAGLLDLDGAERALEVALGHAAVARHQAAAVLVQRVLAGFDVLGHLVLQGLHQHPPRAVPESRVQRTARVLRHSHFHVRKVTIPHERILQRALARGPTRRAIKRIRSLCFHPQLLKVARRDSHRRPRPNC